MAFLLSPIGRWLAGALAALLLIVGFTAYQRHKGAENLQRQIDTQNQEAKDAAQKAREDAERKFDARQPDGVRDPWCRDC